VLLNLVFNREGLLAPRPTPKLEDHPSSAVRDCLFNLFAAALLIGGRSSIRNLRTRHAQNRDIKINANIAGSLLEQLKINLCLFKIGNLIITVFIDNTL